MGPLKKTTTRINKNYTKIKIGINSWHLPGLQSVNSEQIDKSTLEIVRAGDQLSFNISKQITP